MANWLPVPGYEGMYEVSDDGMVKSLPRLVRQIRWHADGTRMLRERILKPAVSEGYPFVALHRGGGKPKKNARIHTLVAKAFLADSWFPGAIVLHGDDDRTNNHVSNLRWGTQKENMADRYRNESCPHCGKLIRDEGDF